MSEIRQELAKKLEIYMISILGEFFFVFGIFEGSSKVGKWITPGRREVSLKTSLGPRVPGTLMDTCVHITIIGILPMKVFINLR
jgi:hypothetical protein